MKRQAPRQPPRQFPRRTSRTVRPARPPLLTTVFRRPARIGLFLSLVAALVLLIRSFPRADPVPPRFDKPGHYPIHFEPSSFDWSSLKLAHPVDSIKPLPTGKPRSLPAIQHDFGPTYASNPTTHSRQTAIRAAFLRAWEAYKKHAWLHDELTPVEAGWRDPFGGWAATLVDSLDTLWIMDLHADFRQAAAAAVRLDWGNCTAADGVNVFETTIRHLGGFLSAYDLSGEEALLEKAKELGEMLFIAFDTPNHMPPFWMEFEKAREGKLRAGTWELSSAAASLGLEFTRLAQLTGEDKFYDAIDRVRAFLNGTQEETRLPGMWPRHINYRSQNVRSDNTFTLGAGAASLYEYLPKMFMLTGGLEEGYEKMYRRAIDVVVSHLLFRPMTIDNRDILFSGNIVVHHSAKELVPEAQHLGCFAGGMLAMGGRIFDIPEHVLIGEQVMEGCVWAFDMFTTGIMPEVLTLIPCPTLGSCDWDEERWEDEQSRDISLKKGIKRVGDTRYLLRPEAVESVFLLFRITGRKELRDIAWNMFESIQKATKTHHANSAIKNVNVEWDETEKIDSMESFWLSETLKYLYLIYSHPDLINLDDWVFNTEGHPLRRPR